MEWKTGELRQLAGEWYQCVEEIGCDGCAFNTIKCDEIGDIVGNCTVSLRHDDKSVVFKKLEKVGGPHACRNMSFGRYSVILQRYKVFAEPILTDDSILNAYDTKNKTILIALNNKEDMKEEKHSNFENIGKNLKPFDLEAAKAGKPVCTRDGRKARILCYDLKGAEYFIVAAIETHDCLAESISAYDKNGRFDHDKENNNDLMMIPEKKEGWINLYWEDGMIEDCTCIPYATREDALDNISDPRFVTTVKIEWEE